MLAHYRCRRALHRFFTPMEEWNTQYACTKRCIGIIRCVCEREEPSRARFLPSSYSMGYFINRTCMKQHQVWIGPYTHFYRQFFFCLEFASTLLFNCLGHLKSCFLFAFSPQTSRRKCYYIEQPAQINSKIFDSLLSVSWMEETIIIIKWIEPSF